VELIRGTPMLVQAMFLYYGVPMAVGLRIPPLIAGVIVIAINSGAYIAEIVRGAIQSINVGQFAHEKGAGQLHETSGHPEQKAEKQAADGQVDGIPDSAHEHGQGVDNDAWFELKGHGCLEMDEMRKNHRTREVRVIHF